MSNTDDNQTNETQSNKTQPDKSKPVQSKHENSHTQPLTHAHKKLLVLKDIKTLSPEGEDDMWLYKIKEEKTGSIFKVTLLDESSIYDDTYWVEYLVRTNENKIFWIKSHLHLEVLDDHSSLYDETGECLKQGMFTDYWSVLVFPKPTNDIFKALAYWLYYNEPHSMKQEASDYFENHDISEKFSFSKSNM